MQWPKAKLALRQWANDARQAWESGGRRFDTLRGTALFDPDKDSIFTALPSFDLACDELSRLKYLRERYGDDSPTRLALQFLYQLADRYSASVDPFDNLWNDFREELRKTTWLYVGVSNLRYFRAEELGRLPAVDGVSIRPRSEQELFRLGFDRTVRDAMVRDWMGLGASSYVILAQHRRSKEPDNIVLCGDSTGWPKAERLLKALRLLAPGDVSMGGMWLARAARFDVGCGPGLSMTGWSLPAPPGGSEYELTTGVLDQLPTVYRQLLHLDTHGFGQAPGNLDLALRSFMATYDRWPFSSDSQLVDAMVALEALLGTETEIAFRLSFRVAGVLGKNPQQREEIFRSTKLFYDIRSRLVHGGTLKPKHRTALRNVDELRGYVRRLLRSFVRLGSSRRPRYDRRFFAEYLDFTLQDDSARHKLQRNLGLAA
jgi:hypothetical protein